MYRSATDSPDGRDEPLPRTAERSGMEIMMKKTESGRIRKIKQAAACALTLAFLLSACGMAKNSQTASQSSYDAGAGQENYASYREDGGEY